MKNLIEKNRKLRYANCFPYTTELTQIKNLYLQLRKLQLKLSESYELDYYKIV